MASLSPNEPSELRDAVLAKPRMLGIAGVIALLAACGGSNNDAGSGGAGGDATTASGLGGSGGGKTSSSSGASMSSSTSTGGDGGFGGGGTATTSTSGGGGDGGAGGAMTSGSTASASSSSSSSGSSSSSDSSSASSSSSSSGSTSSGSGGGSEGGGGGGTPAELYALAYDPAAQVEHVVTVDATTGDLTSVAQLPSQYQWFSDCVFDPLAGRMYQVSSPDILLAIDAPTGTLIDASVPAVPPPLVNFFMGGVNAAGDIVGHAYDPNVPIEHFVSLDPSSGTVASLGTLPPQYLLFNGTTFDHGSDTLYTRAGNGDALMRFDGSTGVLLGIAPLNLGPYINLIGLTANDAGELVGLAWDPATSVEHVVKINPLTGVATSTDTLPPEYMWFSIGGGVLHADSDRIYMLDGGSPPKLFVIEASTGAFVGTLPLALNGFINPLCLQAMP